MFSRSQKETDQMVSRSQKETDQMFSRSQNGELTKWSRETSFFRFFFMRRVLWSRGVNFFRQTRFDSMIYNCDILDGLEESLRDIVHHGLERPDGFKPVNSKETRVRWSRGVEFYIFLMLLY